MIFDIAEIRAALPDYEIGGELGRGGYGVVFAARHRPTGREVAVKVLVAQDAVLRTRFRDEATILRKLSHPHVVHVYDYVERADLAAIVMVLLSGGNLVSRAHTLDLGAACAVVVATAQALHFAHQSGVLHRDVKPANILFTAAGVPKVSDFGIARIFEGSTVVPSTVIGTPRYMAPEQFAMRRIGPATDLYSLGVVAYELFSGAPPFDRDLSHGALVHHHLSVRPPWLTGVPAPLGRTVLRALAKDPADRHPSLEDFAVDVATAASEVIGPGWPVRTGIDVRLGEAVREAVREGRARGASRGLEAAAAGDTRPVVQHNTMTMRGAPGARPTAEGAGPGRPATDPSQGRCAEPVPDAGSPNDRAADVPAPRVGDSPGRHQPSRGSHPLQPHQPRREAASSGDASDPGSPAPGRQASGPGPVVAGGGARLGDRWPRASWRLVGAFVALAVVLAGGVLAATAGGDDPDSSAEAAPDDSLIWALRDPTTTMGNAVDLGDDLLLGTSNGSYVTRISAAGNVLWQADLPGNGAVAEVGASLDAMLVSNDNSAGIGSGVGRSRFYWMLDAANGQQRWSATYERLLAGPVVVGRADGGDVVVSVEQAPPEAGPARVQVQAVEAADSRPLWTTPLDGAADRHAVGVNDVVAGNGVVYLRTTDQVFAWRLSDGHLLWQRGHTATHVVLATGTGVLLAADPTADSPGGTVQMLSAVTGDMVWERPLPSALTSVALARSDPTGATLAVATHDTVLAVDSRTGTPMWSAPRSSSTGNQEIWFGEFFKVVEGGNAYELHWLDPTNGSSAGSLELSTKAVVTVDGEQSAGNNLRPTAALLTDNTVFVATESLLLAYIRPQ